MQPHRMAHLPRRCPRPLHTVRHPRTLIVSESATAASVSVSATGTPATQTSLRQRTVAMLGPRARHTPLLSSGPSRQASTAATLAPFHRRAAPRLSCPTLTRRMSRASSRRKAQTGLRSGRPRSRSSWTCPSFTLSSTTLSSAASSSPTTASTLPPAATALLRSTTRRRVQRRVSSSTSRRRGQVTFTFGASASAPTASSLLPVPRTARSG